MAKRKTITKKTRFEVFKRDSFTCQYCGQSAPRVVLQVDHIHPVSKDGDNDILNLITSCEDCNGGKSDRLLSDDAAVQKQKSQLDELNARREQLEMMVAWREGLRDLSNVELDALCEAWTDLTGYKLNDNGILQARKRLKQFGLQACLVAIEKSVTYLTIDAKDSGYTAESVNRAWSKVGGICQICALPEWKQKLIHIRNIARKRSNETWWPQTSVEILALFEQAYQEGDSFDQLEGLACRGFSYRELPDVLRRWIAESQKDRRKREREDKKRSAPPPVSWESQDFSASGDAVDFVVEGLGLEL